MPRVRCTSHGCLTSVGSTHFSIVTIYMETKNSELDLMIEVTTDLLSDIAAASELNLERDVREVRIRATSEGCSFLTKRLPALGKSFDKALSQSTGKMDYTGFKTRGGYPEFLGSLFRLVFDHTGRSLCDVSPRCVRYIRQILYLWYKYELPYTQEQESALEARFIATDATLPAQVPDCPVLKGARDLIARVVQGFSPKDFAPRHGPGSVATGELSWEKWRFRRLYRHLEKVLPFSEWYVPSISYLARCQNPLDHLECLEEGTARAVFVPKDSRGPRLISCEPLEYQWAQQAIAAEVVYCINKHHFTSGRVNFTHQEVNRRYAQYGSMGAGWVTLDMADASDRVSTVLVERLFANTHVLEYLLASRTQCTVLPSGQEVRLKKFAPMGSALCFPVESLVFFALAVNVLVHHLGYPLMAALARVKVYGDDLILGFEDYEAVMQYFPYVGLMFNEAKCCTGGSFRESCGMDAYSGEDVTPVKIRTRFGRQRDFAMISSWIEYSNALDLRGYTRCSETIRRKVWELWPTECGAVPYLDHDHEEVAFLHYRSHSACLHTLAPVRKLTRWNYKLHRQEFRGYCVSGLSVKRALGGWERLFRNIASNQPRRSTPLRNIPVGDKSTVVVQEVGEATRFPVRRQVTLSRRWCAFRH